MPLQKDKLRTRKRSFWSQVLLVFLSLILTGCGLRVFPGNRNITQPELEFPRRIEALQFVSVNFNVKILQGSQDGLQFALELLDDLTGLPEDSSHIPMNPVGDGVYTATVNLPLGSNVYYRYIRELPAPSTEVDALGNKIQYRVGTVYQGTNLNDLILGWEDAPYSGPLGLVRGMVIDADNDQPLADVLVSIAGMHTLSDATGRFFFNQLPVGVHNLTALRLDGSHQSFQQEVNVQEGGSGTAAIFSMNALPSVKLTFLVKVPDDAAGAALRMAGNLSQLGRSFAEDGSLRILPARMPELEKRKDGRYQIELSLYAGNDLRYKYSLGDSVLNAERDENGLFAVRRFIVPNRDMTIRDEVESWRVADVEPTVLQISTPPETPPEETVWLQFHQGGLNTLVPAWHIGEGNWIYQVFGSPEEQSKFSYTVCRNAECDVAYDPVSKEASYQVVPGNPAANLHTVSGWNAWGPLADSIYSNQGIQILGGERLSGVELLPEYRSVWFPSYQSSLEAIGEMGFNWLILRPAWKVAIQNDSPVIFPQPGQSMPADELVQLIAAAKELGFKVALYPSLDYGGSTWDWWNSTARSNAWWEHWFLHYDRFLLHFLQIANDNQVDQFIIGGPELAPVFPGAIAQGDEGGDTPPDVDATWAGILGLAKEHFGGMVIWADVLGSGTVSVFDFMQEADAYYLSLPWSGDMPEAWGVENMTRQLDGPVWEFSQAMAKPIFLGLQAGSIAYGEYSGSEPLTPFDPAFGNDSVNLEGQRFYYDLYGNGIWERTWIAGMASQGFFPVVKLTDFSSSIYGKPAMDIMWYLNMLQSAQ